jgi:vacuolar-type H+-ATPase subunit E/Vma4
MEEIVSADAIRGEILEDARKKAARMLVDAAEEAARTVVDIEGKAASVVGEMMRASEARAARFRMETLARIPLERTRMRARFVEKALAGALDAHFAALGEARVALLSEELLSRGAGFLAGKDVSVARKGLPEAVARAVASRALAGSASVEIAEDPGLPAAGLVASARDGSVTLRATMDLVEARLMDEKRAELARALCAEALEP